MEDGADVAGIALTAHIADRTGEWQPVVAELARSQLTGVEATLDMSVTLLPDFACREPLKELCTYPANDLVGVYVLERLWRPLLDGCGCIDEGVGPHLATTHENSGGGVRPDVIRHVGALARVGLLRRVVAAGKVVGVVLHPVICDYSRWLLSALLSSAREFHWSYTYTGALGDSSSCTCWHSIVYDLYLFVLDLCISW